MRRGIFVVALLALGPLVGCGKSDDKPVDKMGGAPPAVEITPTDSTAAPPADENK